VYLVRHKLKECSMIKKLHDHGGSRQGKEGQGRPGGGGEAVVSFPREET
jgi:hypothetical protein